jgi:hypothetical protein
VGILTHYDNSYTVDHVVKGADFIHGYDENAVLIVSFEGIKDFSGFTYDGTYLEPEHCLAEGCNDVKFVSGHLVTRDGNAITSVAEATLTASGWADGVYTLSLDGVTATSNQEILQALDITTEQLEAMQAANIQDGGQADNSITLKVYGEVPDIDLPIRVIRRGD